MTNNIYENLLKDSLIKSELEEIRLNIIILLKTMEENLPHTHYYLSKDIKKDIEYLKMLMRQN